MYESAMVEPSTQLDLRSLAARAPEVPVRLAIPDEPRAQFAIYVVRTLQEAGHQAVWAGGCVRDLLLGLKPVDYDVATSARPEEVQRLFRRTYAVGAQFGVILVVGKKEQGEVEVTTFRVEGPYSDGRHPDSVRFASMEEDAKRRDFTINGLFYDPIGKVLYDYVGGLRDLADGVIRAIGDPRERFAEDRLRLLRAVRFAATFGFRVEPQTLDAVRQMASGICSVSPERILRELKLLLVHQNRADAVKLMQDVGLMPFILPEVSQVDSRGGADAVHASLSGSLFQHTVDVLNGLNTAWAHVREVLRRRRPGDALPSTVSFVLAFAALLHVPFPGSGRGPVPMELILRRKKLSPFRKVCRRLRLSNDEAQQTEWLLENRQALLEFPTLRPSQWKPIMADSLFPSLLALTRAEADALGTGLDAVAAAADTFCRLRDEEFNPPPLLTGRDLLELGVPRGPVLGEILRAVREAQLDGEITTRNEAVELARRLVTDRSFAESDRSSAGP